MSGTIFLAVVAAAFLHAAWNALLKSGGASFVAMTALVSGQGLCGVLAIATAPPPAPESWPYIGLSVAAHIGYQLFLMNAYRIGDLTQVYPIARGGAPVVVALISALFLDVALRPMEWLAIGLIACGLMSLGLLRRADGLRSPAAAALALATGGFIAAYSLIDGLGARLAGTALGFYGWSCVLNAALFLLVAAARDRAIPRQLRTEWRILLIGGSASFTAYALVVYAFTRAPIAPVAALRETSIVFALVIGAVFLGERLDRVRIVAAALTVAGAALLRLSGA